MGQPKGLGGDEGGWKIGVADEQRHGKPPAERGVWALDAQALSSSGTAELKGQSEGVRGLADRPLRWTFPVQSQLPVWRQR